jgi:hypothetical protein
MNKFKANKQNMHKIVRYIKETIHQFIRVNKYMSSLMLQKSIFDCYAFEQSSYKLEPGGGECLVGG